MENPSFSRLIAGTMGWGSWGKNLSPAEMAILIRTCVEVGITSFDHADIYGGYTTEADFGKALEISGIQREDIQLISKCGIQYPSEKRPLSVKYYDYSREYIQWSVDQSLLNLRTDHLDLLLLHRPSPLIKPDEIASAIDQLKSAGKIRHFGVSNFTPSQTALIAGSVHVEVNQIQFSITHPEPMTNGQLDDMLMRGITPMAWNPLGTVFRESTEQSERIKNHLLKLMPKYDAPADVLAVSWLLHHPSGVYPVVGTANPNRLKILPRALEVSWEAEDWFGLWVASRGVKVP